MQAVPTQSDMVATFPEGHSLISHAYGLSANNVLEAKFITPNGELVVANDCQN
jgi:hypothetical protein